MAWSEISSVLIMLLLLGWSISIMRENNRLKKENTRLMKKTGEYGDMENDAKEMLKETPEVKAIKSMRKKYGLSLIDAKEVVDSVKKH
ncbi:hypothetical protein ACLIBG_15090 [Virgibacillus sp. W0181]|uniref:hypothetical protein n=1 Tax=Virgibacillus sp. W0181 TaxID=3391581 RepID=UPI003F4516AD